MRKSGIIGCVIVFVLSTISLLFINPIDSHDVFFYERPCIEPLDGYSYSVCEDLIALIDGNLIVIPKNFITDLATIPRWYWIFMSPAYSGLMGPSILHDYLYSCPNGFNRKQIDEIFYASLIENDIKKFTAYKMYTLVRLFGGSHYVDDYNHPSEFITNKCMLTA